jgi:hypothetical protein
VTASAVIRRRPALGSSPLSGVSAAQQRALDAARDHAFARVVSLNPRPEHHEWPAPGEIEQEFREAARRKA